MEQLCFLSSLFLLNFDRVLIVIKQSSEISFRGGDGIPGMEISSSYFEKGEKTKRDYKFIPGERKDDSKRDKINNRAEN